MVGKNSCCRCSPMSCIPAYRHHGALCRATTLPLLHPLPAEAHLLSVPLQAFLPWQNHFPISFFSLTGVYVAVYCSQFPYHRIDHSWDVPSSLSSHRQIQVISINHCSLFFPSPISLSCAVYWGWVILNQVYCITTQEVPPVRLNYLLPKRNLLRCFYVLKCVPGALKSTVQSSLQSQAHSPVH